MRWRRGCPALVLLTVAVGLGSCAIIGETVDAEDALRDAGFREASIELDSNNGYDVVTVTYTGDATSAPRAAEVIWHSFGLRFDAVVVQSRPGDAGGVTFGRGRLISQYGPRDPSLDRRTIGQVFSRTVRNVIIGVVVAGFFFVALVVLVVVLVLRSRRRNRERAAQAWAAAGWGPPPPASAWGQPPPTSPPAPPGWGPS